MTTYEYNQFFIELDKKLPNDPFIQYLGPAHQFKELVEKMVKEIDEHDNEMERLTDEVREAKDIQDDLDDLNSEVEDAIDDLENAIEVDDPEDIDIEMIKGVITDLKQAIK